MPKKPCISCGKEFEAKRDELHELGFPHLPDDAASVAVYVKVPNKPPECFVRGSYLFWHTICTDCGEKFAEASRDAIVVQALVDLLGWYVRQGIDLKKATDEAAHRLLSKEVAEESIRQLNDAWIHVLNSNGFVDMEDADGANKTAILALIKDRLAQKR